MDTSGRCLCPVCATQAPSDASRCPACGATVRLADRFRLESVARDVNGRRRFDAFDERTQQRAVVSVFTQPGAFASFATRGRALDGLAQPSLQPMAAHGPVDATDGVARHWFARAWVDGTTLADSIRTGAVRTEAQAFVLLDALADALEYLHGRFPPIVHGDVRPEHLVIRSDGTFALVDLERAFVEGTVPLRAPRAGDPFAPPDGEATKPSADLYGLGTTVLATILRGSLDALPMRDGRRQFETAVDVSAAFGAIVRRLIEPDRAQRYADVASLRADMIAYATRTPSAPVPLVPSMPSVPTSMPTSVSTPGGPRVPTTANRIPVPAMEARGWRTDGRLVWPVRGFASSYWSEGYSPAQIVGPPKIYPRSGDIRGSWASKSFRGHQIEWLEAHFPPVVGATALLVFETLNPGAICRITDVSTHGAGGVLFEGTAHKSHLDASVLEVCFATPRDLEAVRIEIDQSPIGYWSEIDTVALVAPQPVAHNVNWAQGRRATGSKRSLFGFALVALLVLFGVIGAALGKRKMPPVVGAISGARASSSTPDPVAFDDPSIRWADRVIAYSSQYGESSWSAENALGRPNVYPYHRDSQRAWATSRKDAGVEWLSVGFPSGPPVRRIHIVETYYPGAVRRLDDVTDASHAIVLWQGHVDNMEQSRVMVIDLPDARPITALRIVLDTAGSSHWREIDAVGIQ